MFGHPGLDWSRVLSSMSVEMATGVFPGCPSLLSPRSVFPAGSKRLERLRLRELHRQYREAARRQIGPCASAGRSGRSMGVATVSGSGAANAITIGRPRSRP